MNPELLAAMATFHESKIVHNHICIALHRTAHTPMPDLEACEVTGCLMGVVSVNVHTVDTLVQTSKARIDPNPDAAALEEAEDQLILPEVFGGPDKRH